MKPQFLGLAAAVLLTGCASTQTTHVLLGHARPPIKKQDVQVYLRPPAHYEEIALLTTDSMWDWKFSDSGHYEAVIDRLKSEAARLGANGIVLGPVGDQFVGTVGGGQSQTMPIGNGYTTSGSAWAMPVMVKKGSALAIYVSPASNPTTTPASP